MKVYVQQYCAWGGSICWLKAFIWWQKMLHTIDAVLTKTDNRRSPNDSNNRLWCRQYKKVWKKPFNYLWRRNCSFQRSPVLLNADKVILPGVGSFGDAMNNLNKFGLVPVIKEITDKGTPFLGICLGLQLLFESSDETPGVEGLGLLKGKIVKIPPAQGLKIPHMVGTPFIFRMTAACLREFRKRLTSILSIPIIFRQKS